MSVHEWVTESNSRVYFDTDKNLTFMQTVQYPIAVRTEEDSDKERIIGFAGDLRILDAARVSNQAEPTEILDAKRDKKLIRYLWDNQHVSPFEHVHLTFTVVTDLRTAMQMDTHRTWHRNRYSRRYAHDWVEFVKPVWRLQNTEKGTNKQAGDEPAQNWMQEAWNFEWAKHCSDSLSRYKVAIKQGMAREQAAWFLPTGVFTSTFYTVDLRNLIGFLRVRAEKHAQKEVQDIAYIFKDKMIPLVAPWTAELVNTLNEEWIKKEEENGDYGD